MKIIEKSRDNMNVSELHNLTRSINAHKMETAKGTRLNIDDYVFFIDEKTDAKSGEVIETVVLSIRDDGEIYSTISPTFIEEFKAIREICRECGEAFDHVDVVTGTSRNGRTFITAAF